MSPPLPGPHHAQHTPTARSVARASPIEYPTRPLPAERPLRASSRAGLPARRRCIAHGSPVGEVLLRYLLGDAGTTAADAVKSR